MCFGASHPKSPAHPALHPPRVTDLPKSWRRQPCGGSPTCPLTCGAFAMRDLCSATPNCICAQINLHPCLCPCLHPWHPRLDLSFVCTWTLRLHQGDGGLTNIANLPWFVCPWVLGCLHGQHGQASGKCENFNFENLGKHGSFEGLGLACRHSHTCPAHADIRKVQKRKGQKITKED